MVSIMSPFRTHNHFFSNREQRGLNFFNKSFNINNRQESIEFSRNRPKQFNTPYRTEEDLLKAANDTGIPTAAHFPQISKNQMYSGHNKLVSELVSYDH